MDPMTHNIEQTDIVVRRLRPADLEPVIALDAKIIGRRREEFYKLKLKAALAETGIEVSLAAELDGAFVGFLLAKVYYGEFGMMEKVAVLDAVGVHPEFKGRGIGSALIDQLRTNLLALGIPTLQTEVSWDNLEMLSFFNQQGFRPADRVCLDLDLEKTRMA